MKKCLVVLIVFLFTCIGVQGQYFTGFSVKSYRISSAWPTSFRSVKGSVVSTIGNTGDTRAMSGIRATIYRGGREFAHGVCDDVTFVQGVESYTLRGEVRLADGVSTWDAVRAALSFHAGEYTIDFTVDITHPDGRQDHVVRSGRPLTAYLR